MDHILDINCIHTVNSRPPPIIVSFDPPNNPLPAASSSPYDAVRYPSHVHAQAHPERLATVATLLGASPTPATRCRVLEIGCGDASNLIPQAWALPDSEFVGIDLASQPIAAGMEVVHALGLRNLRLSHTDLLAVDESWGKFDYIVAHGVYSWVPAGVRQGLFKLCQTCLNPNGIAFISYNALPGGHHPLMLREMLRHHVAGINTPEEQLRQAFGFADLIRQGLTGASSHVSRCLVEELDRFRDLEPGQVFHDHLAPINEPCYFSEFIGLAKAAGLRYVGEADLRDTSERGIPEETAAALRQIAPDRLQREQYLDFLRSRRFRQTLLAPAATPLAEQPQPGQIRRLQLRTTFRPVGGLDLRPGLRAVFKSGAEKQIETDFPLGKAALAVLGRDTANSLGYHELLREAAEALEQANVRGESGRSQQEALDHFLLGLATAGVVQLHSWQFRLPTSPGEHPQTSPIVRQQLQRGRLVTNLRHQQVLLEDELGAILLELMDGTRDQAALRRELAERLQQRGIIDAKSPAGSAALRELETGFEKILNSLYDMGLLVA